MDDKVNALLLPPLFPTQALAVRVISGWHQVARVYTTPQEKLQKKPYQLLPYENLESLPHTDGGRESIFNTDGIVKGSNRIEPLLLFSMGVPKVGYMRQRGHHAISLVGKEHFDDPHLFDNNFITENERLTKHPVKNQRQGIGGNQGHICLSRFWQSFYIGHIL